MPGGKLVFVPKGYRVVPEYPTDEMVDTYNCSSSYKGITESYQDMISKSPPIDTPPVLRWEGQGNLLRLMIGSYELTTIKPLPTSGYWLDMWKHGDYNTEQEARRAAEKALGFPDGLIIEEV